MRESVKGAAPPPGWESAKNAQKRPHAKNSIQRDTLIAPHAKSFFWFPSKMGFYNLCNGRGRAAPRASREQATHAHNTQCTRETSASLRASKL